MLTVRQLTMVFVISVAFAVRPIHRLQETLSQRRRLTKTWINTKWEKEYDMRKFKKIKIDNILKTPFGTSGMFRNKSPKKRNVEVAPNKVMKKCSFKIYFEDNNGSKNIEIMVLNHPTKWGFVTKKSNGYIKGSVSMFIESVEYSSPTLTITGKLLKKDKEDDLQSHTLTFSNTGDVSNGEDSKKRENALSSFPDKFNEHKGSAEQIMIKHIADTIITHNWLDKTIGESKNDDSFVVPLIRAIRESVHDQKQSAEFAELFKETMPPVAWQSNMTDAQKTNLTKYLIEKRKNPNKKDLELLQVTPCDEGKEQDSCATSGAKFVDR